jgi:hypothetical protein
LKGLNTFRSHVAHSIRLNRREDGLYHAYNTLKLAGQGAEVGTLQEMLEGQVAVLSSGLLSPSEALSLLETLKRSRLFEPRQYSYLLYPDRALPSFLEKNRVNAAEARAIPELAAMLDGEDRSVIYQDREGVCHFNASFRNASVLRKAVAGIPEKSIDAIAELYEKTFNHRGFTGRSGTFYAYEGLGSIYWHMVSKLLLATQENALVAYSQEGNSEVARKLASAYYDVRKGLGYNKEPALYGAFPMDPYSHTPSGQGAKQPGMTGQVKEEILTRWGELGVRIEGGLADFQPRLLRRSEFKEDGSLGFTWCGASITYRAAKGAAAGKIAVNGGAARDGSSLSALESASLFCRDGKIRRVEVWINEEALS